MMTTSACAPGPIQYQERIRRIIADSLIDPDTHDWVGEVPKLLDGALAHVRERLEAEAALLDTVAERRRRPRAIAVPGFAWLSGLDLGLFAVVRLLTGRDHRTGEQPSGLSGAVVRGS